MAAVLMASLSRLGANAHIARRILKNLAMHAPGRATLRTGAAKWQAQATGSDFAAAVGSHVGFWSLSSGRGGAQVTLVVCSQHAGWNRRLPLAPHVSQML